MSLSSLWSPVEQSGYLQKKRHNRSSWESRYFVLKVSERGNCVLGLGGEQAVGAARLVVCPRCLGGDGSTGNAALGGTKASY